MMMPVPMSMVKQVHQRTGEHQQIRQNAEQMRTVFSPQEKGSDRKKYPQSQPCSHSMTAVLISLTLFHARLSGKIHF